MPPLIGWLVGEGMATLYELQAVYGVQDAYDMLEIMLVDNANERESIKRARKKMR